MAPERETVHASGAPPAVGPYSHAVLVDLRSAGGLLFCSGQIPLDPETAASSSARTPAEQARRCLENLRAVCEAAGTTLERAVRVTVYMTDLAAFAEVNEVYGSFFGEDPPARVTVGVAQLPKGAYVEIDAIVAPVGARRLGSAPWSARVNSCQRIARSLGSSASQHVVLDRFLRALGAAQRAGARARSARRGGACDRRGRAGGRRTPAPRAR